MNEELAMQHSVQNQYQPEPKGHPWVKRIIMTVIVLLLVGGIGYGTAYAWRQYADVKDSLASEQSKNQDLRTKNELLQKQVDDASATKDITDTLPNGKKITYPDTPGNRNILWWSAGASENDGNFVIISHKAYMQYMNSTDTTLLDKVCGAGDSLKAIRSDIVYGMLDTTTKKVTPPQNGNCIDTMASTENTDAVSRAAAQKVLDGIKADIDAFIESATIQ
jgi:hypothetical protein